jgi:hypothetical protein
MLAWFAKRVTGCYPSDPAHFAVPRSLANEHDANRSKAHNSVLDINSD